MSARPDAPLAVTMGDPAGIGPELALGAWQALKDDPAEVFVYIGDPAQLAELTRARDTAIEIATIRHPREASGMFAEALPVYPLALAQRPVSGQPRTANVPAIAQAIETAVGFALNGDVDGVVTNPIQKSVMYEGGFTHPGHTEFLAAISPGGTARNRPVMMLASETLRTVPVTIHLPLSEVAGALNEDLVVETGRITASGLRRYFGIGAPRLAVAGLNPHAGESGALGSEDETILRPAIARLNGEGITAGGPHPADTMFHAEARARFDAALCMYHDQALIPVKTLAFHDAVNVTLGLPFIRSSPDHGTALDIAGQGLANPASLIAALRLARRMTDMAHAYDAAEARGTALG